VASGENWFQSTLYLNSVRKVASRKKGKHVMRDFKWLKERFGNAQAKTIKESKKELEASKGNSSIIYWMKNPDVPDNEDIAIHVSKFL